ncbi:MAG: hypothetical protein EOO09_08505 [Chitinophagaceae bacterium]|nr:MAG: hypothetical protein EOO09_08505 [Chitinophagaceae bacterium]
MVKYLLFFMALSLASAGFSQDLKGKSVITASLGGGSINRSTSSSEQNGIEVSAYSSFGFSLSPQITYGKVNSNNLLFSYGLQLGYDYGRTKERGEVTSRAKGYNLGPVLGLQKFFYVGENIYYAPSGYLQGGYGWSENRFSQDKSRGWNVGAGLNPLSLAFRVRPKANLLFRAGVLSVHYNQGVQKNTSAGTTRIESSLLALYAGFNNFNIGYQIIL